MKREAIRYEAERTVVAIFGAFLYAVGVNMFVVPANLYTGSLMGICQVIRTVLAQFLGVTFTNIDITGVIYYLMNLPLFLVSFRKMGRKFFAKTVVVVTFMTFFVSVVPSSRILQDTMAACVVGGLISGAGTGLILRMGATGGGMDIVGVLLVRWRQDFSVGKVNLLVNIILYGICLFLFDVEVALYSVIYAAVYSMAMDKMHTQNINVEVNIITKVDTTELEQEVFRELGRGITKWVSQGAYTHEQSNILYIMLSKYEVSQLKTIIHKHDPGAFIVVNEGVSVDGNYLKKL